MVRLPPGSQSNTAYYSEVFAGDSIARGAAINAFNAQVHSNYDNVSGPRIVCGRRTRHTRDQIEIEVGQIRETFTGTPLFRPTGHTEARPVRFREYRFMKTNRLPERLDR
jgi:hypothetical protein